MTSNDDGIDFVYESDGWLSIQLRYRAFFINKRFSELTFPSERLKRLLLRDSDTEVYEADILAVGSEFDTDNLTYQVTEIGANSIDAVCITRGSDQHHVEFTFTNVASVYIKIKAKLGI
jgi:hypothetical protein